jgi:hypothetical protein
VGASTFAGADVGAGVAAGAQAVINMVSATSNSTNLWNALFIGFLLLENDRDRESLKVTGCESWSQAVKAVKS